MAHALLTPPQRDRRGRWRERREKTEGGRYERRSCFHGHKIICREQSDDVPLSLLASLTPRPPAPDPQLTQDIDKGSPQSFVVSGRAEREAAEGEREHKRSHGVGGGE